MLNTIKHITDDNFFQEVSALVYCVCDTIQLSENVIFLSCHVVQKHRLLEVA